MSRRLPSDEQELSAARQAKTPEREGLALNSLGVAYRRMGQYERAIILHEQALTIARQVQRGGRSGDRRQSAQWPRVRLFGAGPA